MNKTIWTFWENNETHDNFIINKCIKTWYDFNKDWNIIILNNNNLEKYIKNIPNKLNNYSIQNRSDFYRIYILYYYGGVWLDTSIFFNISIDYFIKDNENKCILFKEKFNTDEHVYCAWMIISLYKNNLFLKNCLDELLDYFYNPKKFLINTESKYNKSYLKYKNWCNFFNKCISNEDKEIYLETHFYLYLIFIKVIDNNLINNDLIYFYDALEFGRYHKKFANNFKDIINNFKFINIKENNFIKLGGSERRLINNIIKSNDYNNNSFINKIAN